MFLLFLFFKVEKAQMEKAKILLCFKWAICNHSCTCWFSIN